MSVFPPETASGQPTPHGQPAFQMVRRGYDPAQVDAYIPELVARLERAEQTWVAQQREIASLRQQASPTFEELGAEAAAVLQEAGRSGEQLVEKARHRAEMIVEGAQQHAEQIRQEVEQERAALYAETQQVREFRDGLLENLGRVHDDITALLERTRRHKDREPSPAGGAARPEIQPPPALVVEESAASAGAAAEEPGHLPAPARQPPRRHGSAR